MTTHMNTIYRVIVVKSWKENSAAHHAKIQRGDLLLQIDDKNVDPNDSVVDVKRCLGPYGSVVHLRLSTRATLYQHCRDVALVREVIASSVPQEDLVVQQGRRGISSFRLLDFTAPQQRWQHYPQHDIGLYSPSSDEEGLRVGGYLEVQVSQKTSQKALLCKIPGRFGSGEWKRSWVHLTTDGRLLIDWSLPARQIAYATVSAGLDPVGQEEQRNTAMCQRGRPVSLDAAALEEASLKSLRSICVHLNTDTKTTAYSEWGPVAGVAVTETLLFATTDAQEASAWLQKINSCIVRKHQRSSANNGRETKTFDHYAQYQRVFESIKACKDTRYLISNQGLQSMGFLQEEIDRAQHALGSSKSRKHFRKKSAMCSLNVANCYVSRLMVSCLARQGLECDD